MTAICYELLPVTIQAHRPVLVQRGASSMPWLIQNVPHVHPNAVVLRQLADFFGDSIPLDQAIVHSTSWRYDHTSDHLLLTYLAVLPQGEWLHHRTAQGSISLQPIYNFAMQYGDHLFPPAHIELLNVIAHALDHLASLSTYDPAIQHMLEAEWWEILRLRVPRAAGYLQLCC